MLGVLVIILRLDRVAVLGFSTSKREIPLIVALRALGSPSSSAGAIIPCLPIKPPGGGCGRRALMFLHRALSASIWLTFGGHGPKRSPSRVWRSRGSTHSSIAASRITMRGPCQISISQGPSTCVACSIASWSDLHVTISGGPTM